MADMMRKAYHRKHGETLMYTVDALQAAANFPKEWSLKPWSASQAAVDDEGEEVQARQPAGLAPSSDEKPSVVEIPDDWRTMNQLARMGLAKKLGAAKNVKLKDADALIEAEVAKRAAAQG